MRALTLCLACFAALPVQALGAQYRTTRSADPDEVEPETRRLVVRLQPKRGDRFRTDEGPVIVRVRAYPPKGFDSLQQVSGSEWKMGERPPSFTVPVNCELGVIAGSKTRGYTEHRLPPIGDLRDESGATEAHRITVELPPRGPSSKVTLTTHFPEGSNLLDGAMFRVVLPLTEMTVEMGGLSVDSKTLTFDVPHGDYEARIDPYNSIGCGNSTPAPAWAQSALMPLTCEGGAPQHLEHRFERGATFNVRFHAPAGLDSVAVTGTLRTSSPLTDDYVSVRGAARPVKWGSLSDRFYTAYVSTQTDRVVFPRTVHAPGEYVLTVSAPFCKDQEVPVTIEPPSGHRWLPPKTAPIEVQLERKPH